MGPAHAPVHSVLLIIWHAQHFADEALNYCCVKAHKFHGCNFCMNLARMRDFRVRSAVQDLLMLACLPGLQHLYMQDDAQK